MREIYRTFRVGTSARRAISALCAAAATSLAGCGEPEKREPLTPSAKLVRPDTTKPPQSPASSGGSPQERPADLLFPHKVGSEWMFVEDSPAGVADVTMTVRPGDDRAPNTFTVETKRKGEVVMVETYTADDEGLSRTAAGYPELGVIEPPMRMIVSPAPDDRRWYWKGSIRFPGGSTAGEAVFTVSGPEPVKNKAGTFQAFRIEQKVTMKLPGGDRVVTNKQWYAPKVGPVRIVTTDGANKRLADLGSFHLPE
jgi:hypothetical protein